MGRACVHVWLLGPVERLLSEADVGLGCRRRQRDDSANLLVNKNHLSGERSSCSEVAEALASRPTSAVALLRRSSVAPPLGEARGRKLAWSVYTPSWLLCVLGGALVS